MRMGTYFGSFNILVEYLPNSVSYFTIIVSFSVLELGRLSK